MNKFRLLRADEIECRISSINEKGLSLLLYKTARTDANLLDETVGPENWANDFKMVDSVLYGEISIYDPALDRWVSRDREQYRSGERSGFRCIQESWVQMGHRKRTLHITVYLDCRFKL